jgi:hypothetical protein
MILPARQTLTTNSPVKNFGKWCVLARSHEVIDTSLTLCAQFVDKHPLCRADRKLVEGWYHLGESGTQIRGRGDLTRLDGCVLSPLGVVCQVALALGVLHQPLSRLLPSPQA